MKRRADLSDSDRLVGDHVAMPNRDWARADLLERGALAARDRVEKAKPPVSDSDAYARRSAARQADMKAAALRREALRRSQSAGA